jgi:hypothetical protein
MIAIAAGIIPPTVALLLLGTEVRHLMTAHVQMHALPVLSTQVLPPPLAAPAVPSLTQIVWRWRRSSGGARLDGQG